MVVIIITLERDMHLKHGEYLIAQQNGIHQMYLQNVFQLEKIVIGKFDLLCMTFIQSMMSDGRQFNYFTIYQIEGSRKFVCRVQGSACTHVRAHELYFLVLMQYASHNFL